MLKENMLKKNGNAIQCKDIETRSNKYIGKYQGDFPPKLLKDNYYV